MIEEIKVLTQKHKQAGHVETKIFIDWEGVTFQELMILARRALIYNFQIGVTKDRIPGVPETWKVNAKDAAVDRTPYIEIVFAPKVERCKLAKTPLEEVEAMMGNLSPEELKILLGELA